MKEIALLDKSLRVRVYYDCEDRDYDDNICISFIEECPEDEKIFLAGETNIYLTVDQAKELAMALIHAANISMGLE